MISASHNPMPDNGIKIFGPGGHKLDDATEDQIEALVGGDTSARSAAGTARPVGADIGRTVLAEDALDRYLRHVSKAATTRLEGLTVVVDCAHGAASAAAPQACRAAGAEVVAIHAEPNGLNINDNCGSTHLDAVRDAVRAHGADLGLAHDGDADRCLAVDASGAVIDGDAIMVVLALAMREADELAADTLVTTVMSNLGLHLAMREAGISVRTTAVGDRYVLEELRAGEFTLGGEQSGHIVLPAFGTTGDGIVTGLRLMSRMAQTGRSLAELAAAMRSLPQVLINVAVADKKTAVEASAVRMRSARPRPNSVTPAESCCAPPGPNSWSGSWWRPPTRTPRAWWRPGGRTGEPTVVVLRAAAEPIRGRGRLSRHGTTRGSRRCR